MILTIHHWHTFHYKKKQVYIDRFLTSCIDEELTRRKETQTISCWPWPPAPRAWPSAWPLLAAPPLTSLLPVTFFLSILIKINLINCTDASKYTSYSKIFGNLAEKKNPQNLIPYWKKVLQMRSILKMRRTRTKGSKGRSENRSVLEIYQKSINTILNNINASTYSIPN